MIKKFIYFTLLITCFKGISQSATASPYSYYGIGDIRFQGSVENRSMGSIGVLQDSIQINMQNPAGLANLKYVGLSVAVTYTNNTFKTNTAEEQSKRSNIGYLAIGIPMGKSSFSFGAMPYSAVGYQIYAKDANNSNLENSFNGSGGSNRAFVDYGYKINKNFNIGIGVHYKFGQISTERYYIRTDLQYGTLEKSVSNLSGFGAHLGLMYANKFKKKYDVYGSFVFTPQTTTHSKNSRELSSVVYSQANGLTSIYDITNIDVANNSIKMPSKFAFGAGIGEFRKWAVGTEFTYSNMKNFSNRFTDIESNFENASKIAIGGFYTPKFNSFSNYFERVTYRAGFRHENTGLIVNEKSINDTAFTFGFGLPLNGVLSKFNLGFEYGKRGTKAANLVQENYFNVSLSFSLTDTSWFIKRKYD